MKSNGSAASRLRAIFKARTLSDPWQDMCYRFTSIVDWNPLKVGACVHNPIVKLGFRHDLYLTNNLLSLYAKCSDVSHVRRVFDEMLHRDVVSFTGLISVYMKSGLFEEALYIFHTMKLYGPLPNAYTYFEILRCCSPREFGVGRCVHGSIIKYGLVCNTLLVSTLINFYYKFHDIQEAFKAFISAKSGDVVTWTMILSFLVQSGYWSRAIRLYADMITTKIAPNGFTFTKVLAASSFVGPRCGKSIHAHMTVLGVELNLIVKTALVDMYSRCGKIDDVLKASELTLERNIYLWTVIISAFSERSMINEAIAAFKEMEAYGISANNVTYLSILSLCSTGLAPHLGRQIHSRVIKDGLESDVPIGNLLIDMYMKCSTNEIDGFRVFQCLGLPDVISWTSLIAGLSSKGLHQESLTMYQEMRAEGIQPNHYTLSTVLKACSIAKCCSETQKLHGYIIKRDEIDMVIVSNALVVAYAGSGMVPEAMHLFERMRKRDAITYTGLATKLNEIGQHELALRLIQHISHDNVKMDGLILSCFISTSKRLVARKTGEMLHGYSVKTGLYGFMIVINGLVDFYGKLGLMNDCHNAFMDAIDPDVVTWNCLISGLASNGMVSTALLMFDEMKLSGVKPDSITFFFMMVACSHGKLVDIGLEYFNKIKAYDIEPQREHYVLLVDLLAGAGRLEKALETIETMPFEPDSEMFKSMVKCCQLHGNLHLGEDMARRGIMLDPSDQSFNQLLSKLYQNCGMSDLGKNSNVLTMHR